jgi:hypothetical protein
MDTPDPKLIAALENTPGNFLERLTALEQKVEELQIVDLQPLEVILHGRTVTLPVFLSPAEGVLVTDPIDSGYTGLFISGNGIEYGGSLYVMGNVVNGQLKIGISDGIFIAAGDETDPSYVQWVLGSGDVVGSITAFELADQTSSGIEIVGRQSTAADNSRVILNARDLSNNILASFHLVSRGDATFDFRSGTNDAKGQQSLVIQTNVKSADNAAINTVLYLDSYNKGTPADGFGTALAMRAEDTNGDMEGLGYFGWRYEDSAHGTERSNAILGSIIDSATYVESILPAAGHAAYVMVDGASNALDFSLSSANFTAGQALAAQININAPMRLRSVSVRNNDTASERKWNWGLYLQKTNTGNADENTLIQVAVGGTAETFTATVASLRTIAASSAPVYICPGVYWLIFQNQHASNTFALGRITGTSFGGVCQTKVITNPFGSTIDFVAATWTKSASVFGMRLNGDVFGQTAAF